MYKLEKKKNNLFKNYYEGFNPDTQKHVICVLDDNHVYFLTYQDHTKSTYPFNNNQKELCFAKATDELNNKD